MVPLGIEGTVEWITRAWQLLWAIARIRDSKEMVEVPMMQGPGAYRRRYRLPPDVPMVTGKGNRHLFPVAKGVAAVRDLGGGKTVVQHQRQVG